MLTVVDATTSLVNGLQAQPQAPVQRVWAGGRLAFELHFIPQLSVLVSLPLDFPFFLHLLKIPSLDPAQAHKIE
jgi:hypothetical protein